MLLFYLFMTSMFRKLTGRRKRTKPTAVKINANTSTESSHASDVEAKQTSRRPQHLETGARFRNIYHSSSQKVSGVALQRANDNVATQPHRTLGSTTDSENLQSRRSVNSHQKQRSSFEEGLSASADSGDSSRLSRRSRVAEDHEIFAPPEAHDAPNRLKAQMAKISRERKKGKLAELRQKGSVSPVDISPTPPESARAPNPVKSRSLRSEDAKQLAINKEAERIARAATALDNRGNEYFERGYYDKAMAAYSHALKLKRRTFNSMLEEADDLFDEAQENEKLDNGDMDPKLLVSMATSINNIGYLRQRAGEATPDETMAAYKKSLRIKRKILGDDSLSVGKTLNNIGSVYYLKKEFEEALPAYREALHIMQSNLGDDHPDVATVMSNMGDVSLAMKNKEESLERYRMALNIRWNSFGEKDPRTMRLLEKIARIEIGDKMPTPRGNKAQSQVYDWDESELYDLDLRPISHELRLLKDELQEDMLSVDLLEKQMAVGMVRDKVKIMRGLRELSDAQSRGYLSANGGIEGSMSYDSSHREDSNREIDDGIVSPIISPYLSGSRSDAHTHIRDRLAQLRERRNADNSKSAHFGNTSLSSLQNSASNLETSIDSNVLMTKLCSPDQLRPTLSSLGPEKVKDASEEIKSALKLKKGIDSLRSYEEPVEKSKAPKILHATWLGEIQT